MDYFAPDLPLGERKIVAATQGATNGAVFGAKIANAAWKTKPKWYVVAANDKMIQPDLERKFAKAMNAKTITLPSSHVAMLSHPSEVAKLIIEAGPVIAYLEALVDAFGLFVFSPANHGQTMTIHDTDSSIVAQASSTRLAATDDRLMVFETLRVRKEGAVLFAEIAAPPMNLLGPELVRDLVSLIQRAEADNAIQVLVFKSADPDYFISHVDVNKIKEYRQEAAKLTGEASIGLLFRHLSASRLVTIAQIEGRVRGAGSEFVLACDMRFAARESAIFSQPEPALGQIPGGGGVQHLARLMGRARALEVMLGAQDYNAELAERYGWIDRALPGSALNDFVRSLAHRIAKFPASGLVAVKDRVNAIALAPVEDFRRDSDLFGEGARKPEAQRRFQAALKRGFETRDAEMDLARLLGDLPDR